MAYRTTAVAPEGGQEAAFYNPALPLYVVEVAGGHGRFTHLLLRAISRSRLGLGFRIRVTFGIMVTVRVLVKVRVRLTARVTVMVTVLVLVGVMVTVAVAVRLM